MAGKIGQQYLVVDWQYQTIIATPPHHYHHDDEGAESLADGLDHCIELQSRNDAIRGKYGVIFLHTPTILQLTHLLPGSDRQMRAPNC